MFSKRNLVGLLAALSTTVMIAGCGDDVQSPTAVIDTAPPMVPAGLQAMTQGRAVALTWQANTVDVDLAGYRVWRQVDAQQSALVPMPQTENRYRDQNPVLGRWNSYIVTAMDINGNESAYALVRIYVDAGYTPISVDPGDAMFGGEPGIPPGGARDQRSQR